MIDLLLTNDTHDLAIIQNGSKKTWAITSPNEDLKQRTKVKLFNFYNDWFYDLDEGIPYFDEVLKKNPNPIIVEGLIKSTILDDKEIVRLNTFEFDLDSQKRTLNLNFEALTQSGSVRQNLDITIM